MATLNEILQLTNAVTQKLLDNEGLITNEIERMLEVTEKGLPAKIDAYSAVLDKLDMESNYFKEKASKYRNAALQLSEAGTKLRLRMKEAMLAHGMLELKGTDERFVLSPSKSAIEITDMTKIPKEFRSEKITVEQVVDKEKLREVLENGTAVGGAELKPVFALKRYINKASK